MNFTAVPAFPVSLYVVNPPRMLGCALVGIVAFVTDHVVAKLQLRSARFVLASSRLRARTVPSELLYSTGMSKWGRYCAVVVVVVTLSADDESVACAQSA